jgi:hydroxymethylglutaryl-CoA reductase
MAAPILGFSKKTKDQKIQWLAETYFAKDPLGVEVLKKYWNSDSKLQSLHDDFIENTLSNYYLPLGVAPNFLINKKLLTLPMVTEESSVVAAASNAAKFWLDKGGFTAKVISTQKNGQIHIDFFGKDSDINNFFSEVKPKLIQSIDAIQNSMQKRGGGLTGITLVNSTDALEGYYQLHCTFETLDAMGANFINSCLETIAKTFEAEAQNYISFKTNIVFPEIVLSILSNSVPECMVRAELSCPIELLSTKDIDGAVFAKKFVRAVAIAKVEPRRAVTHNKGIMNGVDALVIATGNDFRAVEAGAHSYACKSGNYTSLTDAKVENGIFSFWIEIPLALGTIGGLTGLHPLVKFAFSLLQKPNATELMEIIAVAGLAQNFAAIKSLVTTGIQKGHMKMHLMNILNQLETTKPEKTLALAYFINNTITHSSVVSYIDQLRS